MAAAAAAAAAEAAAAAAAAVLGATSQPKPGEAKKPRVSAAAAPPLLAGTVAASLPHLPIPRTLPPRAIGKSRTLIFLDKLPSSYFHKLEAEAWAALVTLISEI